MKSATTWLGMVLALALAWPTGVMAGSDDPVSYTLGEGETHSGDLYLGSPRIRIAGTLDGDLYALTGELEVTGEVTGDVNAWAQRIGLNGVMGDSVRVGGQTIRVAGTINGDLIAFAQTVRILEGAHVTGDVWACGALVQVEGQIDGDLEATGGEIVLDGAIGRNVEIESDIVSIAPEARIGGNLEYAARNRLDIDGLGIVSGSIDYAPAKKKPPVTTRGAGGWFFFMITALIVGLAALALFQRRTADTVATVGTDGLRSAGIGFLTAIVVPVALCIACILIVTIPLVVIAFMLFGVVIYLAKLPVAVWLGNLVLKRFGRADASPYLALVVGMPVLYLIFAIPYVGKITWLGALFVGLGAIVLTAWSARQERLAGNGPTPPGSPEPPPLPPAPSPTPS